MEVGLDNSNSNFPENNTTNFLEDLFANSTTLVYSIYEDVTKSTQPSSVKSSETSTSSIPIPTSCVREKWSEPDFARYACEANTNISMIAAIFLLSMIVFGVIKCLVSHGIRNIFDLRRDGISFPKRPEFFVLICSSLPLVFTVLTRSLFTPLSVGHDMFIRGWGLAQTRFFFDLFTRTATVYHLVYWVYRTPIIHLLWRIKVTIDGLVNAWKNRPKPEKKPVPEKKPKLILTSRPKRATPTQPRRTGRTTEHGYGRKRHRSKSLRSNRSNGKSSTTASQSGGDQQPPNSLMNTTQSTHVINAGGVNLISAQPLFTDQPQLMASYTMGMMPVTNVPSALYGQIPGGAMTNYPNNFNMYSPMGEGQPGAFGATMGYGMNFGMSPLGMNMTQPGMMVQNYSQQSPVYGLAQSVMGRDPSMGISPSGTETSNLLETGGSELQTKPPKQKKEPVIVPPPTRLFCSTCKRIIPGCIYLISFCATLPSVFAFEEIQETSFKVARCTPGCRSYFYYDLVVIVTVPTIMVIVAFYHAALSRKQLNGGVKMSYRLRCYYVTFILLNIPMFVLMLTSIAFTVKDMVSELYGSGIVIAMTAYHANFALKSTVYTTGCNCICCTDACIQRFSIINRFLTFFTTPVAFKDKEALLEGTVIPVNTDMETKMSPKSVD
ncbi:hypothetical protein CSKR_109587 [Clonorchis sinensis]|uniref:Uncharacterized protein n=2 Tax=Clonorchis sinensis TaxID=79923 RepID=A0A8T1MIB0_CLOSI|nr:hypothetical protein CSKR_109587 [Clonorchis sinensis]GAA34142.2 hypothetical protein CLF_110520 [Clonorchis sinensis]